MIAQRAARGDLGAADAREPVDARRGGALRRERTPRGWLRPDGDLVWGEQELYLQQPGYGTSYLIGKALIERCSPSARASSAARSRCAASWTS